MRAGIENTQESGVTGNSKPIFGPATKEYYDDLMSVLGLRPWFERSPGDPLNYGPDGARGSQL